MKGWRTILINGLSTVGVLALLLVDYARTLDIAALGLSPRTTLMIVGGLGVANIVLRFVTSTPIGKKE